MTDQTQSMPTAGATQPSTAAPALAAPAPGAVDPWAKQEQEFRDAVAKLHPVVQGVVAKVEAVALETVDDVKAEAVLLGARFKTLAARLEDMAHNGVTNNPVFKQATDLVNHVVGIAKSL